MLGWKHILIWTQMSDKNQKMILKFFFSSLRIMQFLEKLCKMWENIDILNLSQQKEEGII